VFNIKKLLISFVVVTLLTIGPAFAEPATQLLNQSTQICNIGVVDVNKVMKESPKIKAVQEELNQKCRELSDILAVEKENLEPEEFTQRQTEAYTEFVKLKQELEGKIDADLQQAFYKVSEEKNLTVIQFRKMTL
jgi:Skp family chaperone for outer membrane proteins